MLKEQTVNRHYSCFSTFLGMNKQGEINNFKKMLKHKDQMDWLHLLADWLHPPMD